jgi:hypothetical protein
MPAIIHAIVDHAPFDAWERDWISYLLGDFQVQFHLDPNHSLILPNAIVIISMDKPGKEQAIKNHLLAFKNAGKKVGLIHLSDEWAKAPIEEFYDHADFIFRNYYRPTLANRPNCYYFGLGYRSGFAANVTRKPIEQRRYQWSFAGELKTSRFQMMAAAYQVPGGKYHLTKRFNDPNGLSPAKYAAMMDESIFVLCPRGFNSLDCFRTYEALEAGAIPLVEDPAHDDSAGKLPDPSQSYWHQAYGETFPCPRIGKWENLPAVISRIDTQTAAAKTRRWWADYKLALRKKFAETITQRLI